MACARRAPSRAVVIFGEIIPQAYCGRNSLFVGALSVPLVWVFLVVTYPLTKPIALVLDYLLGREISNVLSRQMLLQLVNLNVESADHNKKSGLTKDDHKLLKGALTFKDRTGAPSLSASRPALCADEIPLRVRGRAWSCVAARGRARDTHTHTHTHTQWVT